MEYNLRLIHTLAIFFTWPVFVFVAMAGVMCRGSVFDAPAAFWNRVRNGFAPGGGNGGDPPVHLGRNNGRQPHGSPKKSRARRTKNNHAVRYYFWLLELMLILFPCGYRLEMALRKLGLATQFSQTSLGRPSILNSGIWTPVDYP